MVNEETAHFAPLAMGSNQREAYNPRPDCPDCGGSSSEALPCEVCAGGMVPEDMPRRPCCKCGEPDAPEQYSFGVYAGRYCEGRCWASSGFRDATDSTARFDPADAGESMDPDYGPGEEAW